MLKMVTTSAKENPAFYWNCEMTSWLKNKKNTKKQDWLQRIISYLIDQTTQQFSTLPIFF